MRVPAQLVAIQQIIVGISRVERKHYRPQSERRENVAEHSMSVATLAWFLHRHVKSKTNLDLVIKYAIVHDFVEAYAGDVSTFVSSRARAEKEQKERAALETFATEFTTFPDMVAFMRSYQDMHDAEARFVWTADKIQQLILGHMDNWRGYKDQNITRKAFAAKLEEQLSKSPSELKPLFSDIIAWSKETYWSKK